MTILRQQVASHEASEHEAQVLEEVQRSVSREGSAGGNIAEKMRGGSWDLMLCSSICIAALDHTDGADCLRGSLSCCKAGTGLILYLGDGSLFQPKLHF